MGQKAAVRYSSPLSETIKKSISEKISWRPPPAPLKATDRISNLLSIIKVLNLSEICSQCAELDPSVLTLEEKYSEILDYNAEDDTDPGPDPAHFYELESMYARAETNIGDGSTPANFLKLFHSFGYECLKRWILGLFWRIQQFAFE